MGTSLKVQPFASLVSEVRYNVPKLLINLENSFATPSPFLSLRKETKKSNQNRHYCESNCDDGVYALCELLGWREELMKMYNDHIDKMELFEFKGDEKSSSDEDDAKLEKAMKELKVAD
jgi:NAD-dependent deacetylase sirtuin 2